MVSPQHSTSGHFEADTVLSGKRKGQAVATGSVKNLV